MAVRDGGFQDPPTPHQPRRFEDDARDVGGAGPSLDDADASGLLGDVARPDPLRVPESAPEWSPAELERYLHVVAMERHTADAVRRPALVDALHEHVEGVGNPNPMLLLGPSGSGKSTAGRRVAHDLTDAADAPLGFVDLDDRTPSPLR